MPLPFVTVDHVAEILGELKAQFANSANLKAFLTIYGQRMNGLEGVLDDVYLARTLPGALNYGQRGPSGTGTGLTDGTVVWNYIGTPTASWGPNHSYHQNDLIVVPITGAPGQFNVWRVYTASLTSGSIQPAGLAAATPARVVEGSGIWQYVGDREPGTSYSTGSFVFANSNVYELTADGTTAVGPTPTTSYVNASLDNLGRIVGEPRSGRSDAQYAVRIAVRRLLNRSSGMADEIIRIINTACGGALALRLDEQFPAALQFTARGVWPDGFTSADGLDLCRQAKAAGVRVVFVSDNAITSDVLAWDGPTTLGSASNPSGSAQWASAIATATPTGAE